MDLLPLIAPSPLLLLLLLSASLHLQHASGSTVGVAYGRNGNNLPSPSQVVRLLKSNNVDKVRIYGTDPLVLDAFRNSGIALIVGAQNTELANLATASGAKNWVQTKIVPYASVSSIKGIAVGNEVLTKATSYIQYLYPAMANVHNALAANGLQNSIFVSTTHAMDVIDSAHPYPPSAGEFASSIKGEMSTILTFLAQNGSPFLANVYPYIAYTSARGTIPLAYALFKPGTDNYDNGLHYRNLFDAQVDTLIAAMSKLGHPSMKVIVTETGWPHEGEASATVSNAQAYNSNLVAHVPHGTPRRPNTLLSSYIFSLFDENLKSPGVEQHYGVFHPDQTKVYDLTF